MTFFPHVMVLLTGVLNAIHSGTNAELNITWEHPWWAGVFVCAISGVVPLLGVGYSRESFPSASGFSATPWWAWLGAAIAAIPVISTLFFAGLLGFSVHPMSLPRIAGGVLMLAVLFLVCVF